MTPLLETIRAQAATALSGSLGGGDLRSFQVGALGNFPWYFIDPATGNFNLATYNWIASNVNGNTPPITQNEIFANTYSLAINQVQFQLSTTDDAALKAAQQSATEQLNAVLSAWKTAIGPVPSAKGQLQPIDLVVNTIATTWASPPTTWHLMRTSESLGDLLKNAPASGQPVLAALTSYLDQIDSVVTLINEAPLNSGLLAIAQGNATSVSTRNGGLVASDGNVYPAYAIAQALSDLQRLLTNTGNTISAQMSISQSTNGGSCSVTMSDSSSFDIGISDFHAFSFPQSSSSNYFQQNIVSDSSNIVTMSVTWTAPTMVNFGPVAYDTNTELGWYWLDPIREALKNGQADVTGFRFASASDDTAQPSYYGESGGFGYLTGVAIANYPTVTINVTSSDTNRISSIHQDITSSSSLAASFLGVDFSTSTGSSSSSSTTASATMSDDRTSVTIVLTPPAQSAPGVNSRAWILGVQTLYPAAS